MNDTARTIWSCFLEKKNIDTIINELVEKYEVSREKAKEDFGNIVSKFEKEKLISIVESNFQEKEERDGEGKKGDQENQE